MARERIKAQALTDSHDRIVTIDNIQDHIHNGDMFRVNAVFSLGVAGVKYALLRVGSIPIHIYGEISASGESTMNFYESPTTSADGTPISVLNKNKTSSKVSEVTAFDSPTVTTPGTLLDSFLMSGAINAGGRDRSENEWSLLPNTDYLIKVTAVAASDYAMKIDFYEEVI